MFRPDQAPISDPEVDAETLSILNDDTVPRGLRKFYETAESDMDNDDSDLLRVFMKERGIDPDNDHVEKIAG